MRSLSFLTGFVLALSLLSTTSASLIPSSPSAYYCKCICFSNYTIVPLYLPSTLSNPSKPCLSCSRQFCLDQKLPICRGAEVPDLDTDTGTGKEGDVEARCFQRDSPRDQLIVTSFLIIVLALLLTAAIRNRLRAAINERGRPAAGDLRGWGEALLPSALTSSSLRPSQSSNLGGGGGSVPRTPLMDFVPEGWRDSPVVTFLAGGGGGGGGGRRTGPSGGR